MLALMAFFISVQLAFCKNQQIGICASLGGECSSKFPREDRCCDGGRGGTLTCEWYPGHYYVDSHDIKYGRCCIKSNKDGCSMDTDCCGETGRCEQGICIKNSSSKTDTATATARSPAADVGNVLVEDGGTFMDRAENPGANQGNDDNTFGLSRISQIFGLIIMIFCVSCNLVYCYFKFVRKKKGHYEYEYDSDEQIDYNDVHRQSVFDADNEL
eukprot:UN01381